MISLCIYWNFQYTCTTKIINQLRKCLEDHSREGILIFPADPRFSAWMKAARCFKQIRFWVWTCCTISTHLKGSNFLSCSKSVVFSHGKGWFDFSPYMKKLCDNKNREMVLLVLSLWSQKTSLKVYHSSGIYILDRSVPALG